MTVCFSSILLFSCGATRSYCPATPIVNHSINASQLLSDLKVLSGNAMLGRETGFQGNLRAQKFLTARFKEIGLDSFNQEYSQEFKFGENNILIGKNIIGWLPGKVNPSQYIVITAHYDHIGNNGNKIFNGADDNASGVAAMLSLAHEVKKHGSAHSIIFVATDAEEKGLWGSKAFVNSPPVSLENILYNINLDMIARGEIKNRLYVSGTKKNNYLKELVNQDMSQFGICLKRGHEGKVKIRGSVSMKMDWSKVSDHAPFLNKNIPYLYFGVAPHVDYHKPSDTFEKVKPDFYTAAVETILTIFNRLDRKKKQLRLNNHLQVRLGDVQVNTLSISP